MSNGQIRLPGFRYYSADINELAQNSWKNFAEKQMAPWVEKNLSDKQDPDYKIKQQNFSEFFEVVNRLLKNTPQLFKFIPGLWREYRGAMVNTTSSSISVNQYNHIFDIMTQAEDIWKKLRDDPRSEIKVPNLMADFKPDETMDGFRKLEAGVYNWRSENMVEGEGSEKIIGDFGDGWTIKQLFNQVDLDREGELMGHCVGGYCSVVTSGDSLIYSLRDPKNIPHATIEIRGQSGVDSLSAPDENGWVRTDQTSTQIEPGKIVQIQGKANQEPKGEYKAYIKTWFKGLQDIGIPLAMEYEDNPEIGNPLSLNDFVHNNVTDEGIRREVTEYGIPITETPYFADNLLERLTSYFIGDKTHVGGYGEYGVPEDILSNLKRFGTAIEPTISNDKYNNFVKESKEGQSELGDKFNEMLEYNHDFIYENLTQAGSHERPDEEFPEDYGDNPEILKGEEAIIQELKEETGFGSAFYIVNEFLEFLLKDKIVTTSFEKIAVWGDVVDKATRYYNEGRVEILNNTPDHAIANIRGDTGTYETEIGKQDPNRPNALSGGSCTCPWGQVSWGRTRIWKKYEGRSCAHCVVLTGEAQRQPFDQDEQGNEQGKLFNPTQTPGKGQSYDQFMTDMPKGGPKAPGQLQNMKAIEQLTLPGALGAKKKLSYTEELSKWAYVRGVGGEKWQDTEFSRSLQDEALLWGVHENDLEEVIEQGYRPHSEIIEGLLAGSGQEPDGERTPMAFGIFDEYKEEFSGEFYGGVTPDEVKEELFSDRYKYQKDDLRYTFANVIELPHTSNINPGFGWNYTSAFLNGDFVKNKIKLIGQDDRGQSYAVPRNTVGEVLFSDDNETIAIFNLKSGPLGAHLIRVEETTDKFIVAGEPLRDRGPAPTRKGSKGSKQYVD